MRKVEKGSFSAALRKRRFASSEERFRKLAPHVGADPRVCPHKKRYTPIKNMPARRKPLAAIFDLLIKII